MGIILGIWSGLLGLWIHIGEAILPPTVHPMLVHFPIACLYGALAVDVVGRLSLSRDRYFDRVSFWLIVVGLLGGIAAAAAGVISEQYVHWTPTTAALLSGHQRDAILTGLLVIMALAARLIARYPGYGRSYRTSSGWSFAGTGRGRASPLSLVLLVGAVLMITITASVGGTMVYRYGVGIHGVSFQPPHSVHAPRR
ncbi:MAG: DUF2231 domain-containing protein [Clostridia bacterium]